MLVVIQAGSRTAFCRWHALTQICQHEARSLRKPSRFAYGFGSSVSMPIAGQALAEHLLAVLAQCPNGKDVPACALINHHLRVAILTVLIRTPGSRNCMCEHRRRTGHQQHQHHGLRQ